MTPEEREHLLQLEAMVASHNAAIQNLTEALAQTQSSVRTLNGAVSTLATDVDSLK